MKEHTDEPGALFAMAICIIAEDDYAALHNMTPRQLSPDYRPGPGGLTSEQKHDLLLRYEEKYGVKI